MAIEEVKNQLGPQERFEMMTQEQLNISRPFFEAVKQGNVDHVLEIANRIDISNLYTDGHGFY